ncbi:hypothetical protein ACK8OU_13355, partial [Defluviimonas sp. KMU-169]
MTTTAEKVQNMTAWLDFLRENPELDPDTVMELRVPTSVHVEIMRKATELGVTNLDVLLFALAEEERQLADLRAEGLDIRVLHGATIEIAGVRIIGATLWTDLQLYPEFDDLARIMVSAYMQDYRAIRTAPDTRFTVADMLDRHAQDKAALLTALRAPYEGPTVVMTHHL